MLGLGFGNNVALGLASQHKQTIRPIPNAIQYRLVTSKGFGVFRQICSPSYMSWHINMTVHILARVGITIVL